MGFDDCYFLEDSFDLEKQGYGAYVSDEAAVDKIFQTFRQHIRKTNAPLFSFTVTIQNHGPYEKKYGNQPPKAEKIHAIGKAGQMVPEINEHNGLRGIFCVTGSIISCSIKNCNSKRTIDAAEPYSYCPFLFQTVRC